MTGRIGEPAEITVVKLRPDGTETARYVGVPIDAPPGWIAVRATWTFRSVDTGHMRFDPGDTLDEFFALDRPYNAFALYRGGREFVAWYCNVTHPTTVRDDIIYWHDLWVDVLVFPDRSTIVLDEDELDEAGLGETDPALYALILTARDELLDLAARNAFPFCGQRHCRGSAGGR